METSHEVPADPAACATQQNSLSTTVKKNVRTLENPGEVESNLSSTPTNDYKVVVRFPARSQMQEAR